MQKFMIHGIMGSFMLNGVGSSAGKLLAWVGVGILVVHTVIGVILTVQSLQTAKQSVLLSYHHPIPSLFENQEVAFFLYGLWTSGQ